MKTFKIFSNNYNVNTGLGKQTTTLVSQLKYDCYLKSFYEKLSFIKNRNIFNMVYFLVCSFLSISSKSKIISMSVVSPLNSHAVHFSSCHFFALKHVYKYFYLRLFLNPFNLFYSLLEFLHYKNQRSINIFLSNIEKERFKKVYGETNAICKVIRPRLIDNYYNVNNELFKRGKNFISVSHNFKLKGGEIINELSEKFPNYFFNLVGDSKGSNGNKNIILVGKQDVSKFSFNKFNTFIYPSKLDSHSFALEEALINGLIPISSDYVGFAEYLSENQIINKSLICRNEDWCSFVQKFIEMNDSEFKVLRNELLLKRKNWLSRDIFEEYKSENIIYT